MKITHTAIAAAMAISAISLPTVASEATDKAALRRTYTALDGLAKRGDIAKMGSYLTSDFKMRGVSGQVMGKQQTLQTTGSAMKTMQMKFATTKILSMRVTGNRAVVEAVGGGTITQRDPQGKAHKIMISGKTRDQWIKVGGAWKERASEQLTEEVRMDGRVVSKR